jgi:hypothetical protein
MQLTVLFPPLTHGTYVYMERCSCIRSTHLHTYVRITSMHYACCTAAGVYDAWQ